MAKKNATAVLVMPVRDDPDSRLLKQIFVITMEEHLGLKFFASAPRPSDCTAKQRLLFRQLQERDLVEVIEYPCLDGPRWVPNEVGTLIVRGAADLIGVNIPAIAPAKVLQFPSPR